MDFAFASCKKCALYFLCDLTQQQFFPLLYWYGSFSWWFIQKRSNTEFEIHHRCIHKTKLSLSKVQIYLHAYSVYLNCFFFPALNAVSWHRILTLFTSTNQILWSSLLIVSNCSSLCCSQLSFQCLTTQPTSISESAVHGSSQWDHRNLASFSLHHQCLHSTWGIWCD